MLEAAASRVTVSWMTRIRWNVRYACDGGSLRRRRRRPFSCRCDACSISYVLCCVVYSLCVRRTIVASDHQLVYLHVSDTYCVHTTSPPSH